MTTWRRAGLAVVTLLCGVGSGVASVAVHDTRWGWPLAVIAVAAVLFALPGGWWGRPAFCAGWSATVFALAPARADGDYLISSDPAGYGLLLVAVLVVVVGVFSLARGTRATGRADAGEAPPHP